MMVLVQTSSLHCCLGQRRAVIVALCVNSLRSEIARPLSTQSACLPSPPDKASTRMCPRYSSSSSSTCRPRKSARSKFLWWWSRTLGLHRWYNFVRVFFAQTAHAPLYTPSSHGRSQGVMPPNFSISSHIMFWEAASEKNNVSRLK